MRSRRLARWRRVAPVTTAGVLLAALLLRVELVIPGGSSALRVLAHDGEVVVGWWRAGAPVPGRVLRAGLPPSPFDLALVPSFGRAGGWFEVGIPLWIPLAVVTGLAWRDARRHRADGRCRRCGYDRRGLDAGAVCPECGARPR